MVWVAPFAPRPVFSPEPIAMRRLLVLIALVARVVGRVQERRQALHLVGLEHLRRRPPGPTTRTSRRPPPPSVAKSTAKWRHGVPRDEEQRERDRHVDECRSRGRAGRSRASPGAAPAASIRAVVSRSPQPPRAIDDERRQARATSSTLPSSDGWKLKNGEVDRSAASRAWRPTPSVSTAGSRRSSRRRGRSLQLAQPRVVDARDGEHQHEPDPARRRAWRST